MARLLISVSVLLSVSLAAQERTVSPFPKLDARLTEWTRDGGPGFVVGVVQPDGSTWLKAWGEADVGRRIRFTADSRIPVGSVTRAWLSLAVRTAGDRVPLGAPIGESSGGAVAGIPADVCALKWGALRSGTGLQLPEYRRYEDPGTNLRPLTEVLAEHVFLPAEPLTVSTLGDEALLQYAYEVAVGMPFAEAFAERIAPALGLEHSTIGNDDDAAVRLYRRVDGAWRDAGPQPVCEVPAAYDGWSTAADMLRFARELLAQRRAAGLPADVWPRPWDRRSTWPWDPLSFGVHSRGPGAHCELRVFPSGEPNSKDGDIVTFVFTNRLGFDSRGEDERIGRLAEALWTDLFGPEPEIDDGWNSAVGLGTLPRPPSKKLRGTWRGTARRGTAEVDVVLRVGGLGADLAVDGANIEVTHCQRDSVRATIRFADPGDEIRLAVRRRGEELVGSATWDSGERLCLPYRITLVRGTGKAVVVPSAEGADEIVRAAGVDVKLRELGRSETAHGRVLGVVRPGGGWVGASGFADVERGLPMLDDRALPLGSVTEELFEHALLMLEAKGRVTRAESLEDLWGDDPPPYDRRLGRLTLADVLDSTAPLPDYFRFARDAASLRPLGDVLRAHAFPAAPPSWRHTIGRAMIQDALVRGKVIVSWPAFVREELGPTLGMTGLRDVVHADADRRRLRLYDDGRPVAARLSEVPTDYNAWATPKDVVRLLAFLLTYADRTSPESAFDSWRSSTDMFRDDLRSYYLDADESDMVCRLRIYPTLHLGLFFFGNDGDTDWIDELRDPLLDQFVKERDIEGTFGGAGGRFADRPKPSTWIDGRYVGLVTWDGVEHEIAVTVDRDAAAFDLTVDRRMLELRQVNIERMGLWARTALPTALVGRFTGPDAELVLEVEYAPSKLRGTLELRRDGWFALPYELDLTLEKRPR